VIIVINDTKDTVADACRARLDVFDLVPTGMCEQILYIDTDVLIFTDLNPVFDILQEDRLYTVEEGYLHHNYWGGELFGADIKNYHPSQKGFNSGILLFRNSPTMRQLFDDKKQILFDDPTIWV
jgi:lipopolysaccharide biosynthesis glycosyltransferase